MDTASAILRLDRRLYVLVVDRDQLRAREAGDLITAEIESVQTLIDNPTE